MALASNHARAFHESRFDLTESQFEHEKTERIKALCAALPSLVITEEGTWEPAARRPFYEVLDRIHSTADTQYKPSTYYPSDDHPA